MSNTTLSPAAEMPRVRPDFDHVSDAMLYDITRHTASVLSSGLLARKNAAGDDAEREHWAARRRLVKQQVRALEPADRSGLIAQEEAWEDETRALFG